MKTKVFITVLFFVFSSLAAIGSPAEDNVFNKYKAQLDELHDIYKQINRLRNASSDPELVQKGGERREEAREVYDALTNGIKNASKFEKSNKEAKKFSYSRKIRGLKGYLKNFDKYYSAFTKKDPKAEKAFEENIDFLVKADKLFRKFHNNSTSTTQAFEMLEDIISAKDYGALAANNLEAGIKDMDHFEETNMKARKIGVKGTIKSVRRHIKKLEKSFDYLAKSLEDDIKKELDILNKHANFKTAPAYINRIKDNFVLVEKLGHPYAKQKPAVIKKAQAAYDKIMEEAANNRMPQNGFGSGSSKMIKEVTKIYSARYNKEPARVVIATDWEEERVVEIKENTIVERITKYVYAHVAVKKGENYIVFVIGFGKVRVGGGKYGELDIVSFRHNYPVLGPNINK